MRLATSPSVRSNPSSARERGCGDGCKRSAAGAVARHSRRSGALLLTIGLLLAGMPASAEPLGRLFFTPERRAALERQRQLNIQEVQQVAEGATLSVSGVVQRSSGKRTAWVNGIPQHDDTSATGVRIEVDRNNPARTTIVASEEPPASLKVGETINRATRERTSGVGAGSIIAPSSTPARKPRN